MSGDIDADDQAWQAHYNFERPHRGYRTNGRRPAQLFYSGRLDLVKAKGWDPYELTIEAQTVNR